MLDLLWLRAYLMTVILETRRVHYSKSTLTWSAPDDGYYRNSSYALCYIYFDLERTWWRVLQKLVVCTMLDLLWLGAYLMTGITETRRVHYAKSTLTSSTWWRVLQKLVVRYIYLLTWSVPDDAYSRNLSCALF
jgi:hypothetical protein